MLRLFIVGLFFFLTASYAGTPSTTDSSVVFTNLPQSYMNKRLVVDQTTTEAVAIIATNTATTNNCPARQKTTANGMTYASVQYVQTGEYGQVPAGRYLNDSNYYNYSGNLWDGVYRVPCSSGCCSSGGVVNCPYWIYNYSMLYIICAPAYSDWTAYSL